MLTTIKEYASSAVQNYKNKRKNIFKRGWGGGGARARFAGPVSAIEMLIVGKGNLRNP